MSRAVSAARQSPGWSRAYTAHDGNADLELRHARGIERARDREFLVNGEGHTGALLAVAQSRVVYGDGLNRHCSNPAKSARPDGDLWSGEDRATRMPDAKMPLPLAYFSGLRGVAIGWEPDTARSLSGL
jgi:hypothetical protein